jgi:hypothetical protein
MDITCFSGIRDAFLVLLKEIDRKFPNSRAAVQSIICSTLFTATLLLPEKYGLIAEGTNVTHSFDTLAEKHLKNKSANKTLLALSDLIQWLCNKSCSIESAPEKVNIFIEQHQQDITSFFDDFLVRRNSYCPQRCAERECNLHV